MSWLSSGIDKVDSILTGGGDESDVDIPEIKELELPEYPSFDIDWDAYTSALAASVKAANPPVAPEASQAAKNVTNVANKTAAQRGNPVTRQSTLLTGPGGSPGTGQRRRLLGGAGDIRPILGV